MAVNLNIGRGLNNKEELLIHTIRNQDCDICGVSEVDIEDFDEKKPYSITGYNTFFPLQRTGATKKTSSVFCKEFY